MEFAGHEALHFASDSTSCDDQLLTKVPPERHKHDKPFSEMTKNVVSTWYTTF